MPRVRVWLWSTLHRWFPTSPASAYCSFCGRGRNEAGPFVEGAVGSMICRQCVLASVDILADWEAKRDDPNRATERPKSFDHHGLMNAVLKANLIVFIIAVVATGFWFAARPP